MTIFAAFAPGPLGELVVQRAQQEAMLRSERLVIVNGVWSESFIQEGVAASDELERIREQSVGLGIDVSVRQLEADLSSAGAGALLLDEARAVDATLVVVGVRSRSPVGKALLGSVAQQLILHAHCPVLSLRLDND